MLMYRVSRKKNQCTKMFSIQMSWGTFFVDWLQYTGRTVYSNDKWLPIIQSVSWTVTFLQYHMKSPNLQKPELSFLHKKWRLPFLKDPWRHIISKTLLSVYCDDTTILVIQAIRPKINSSVSYDMLFFTKDGAFIFLHRKWSPHFLKKGYLMIPEEISGQNYHEVRQLRCLSTLLTDLNQYVTKGWKLPSLWQNHSLQYRYYF